MSDEISEGMCLVIHVQHCLQQVCETGLEAKLQNYPENPDPRSDFNRGISLPVHTRILLIAGFICSNTEASRDRFVFDTTTVVKRRRVRNRKSHTFDVRFRCLMVLDLRIKRSDSLRLILKDFSSSHVD